MPRSSTFIRNLLLKTIRPLVGTQRKWERQLSNYYTLHSVRQAVMVL